MLRFASSLSSLVLVGATVALAACGGSTGGSSAGTTGTSTTATAGGSQPAALQKFTQCLKDNGVTLPQRGAGGGGRGGYGGGFRRPGAGGSSTTPGSTTVPGGTGTGRTRPPGGGFRADPKLQKAMQACAKLRPQGAGGFGGRAGGQGRGGPGAQQSIKAFTPYLNCLKDKGLDVRVSDGFNALRNLKRDDPKVQAALTSCQSKIPQRPQGAPGRGTAPGSGPGDTTGSQS